MKLDLSLLRNRDDKVEDLASKSSSLLVQEETVAGGVEGNTSSEGRGELVDDVGVDIRVASSVGDTSATSDGLTDNQDAQVATDGVASRCDTAKVGALKSVGGAKVSGVVVTVAASKNDATSVRTEANNSSARDGVIRGKSPAVVNADVSLASQRITSSQQSVLSAVEFIVFDDFGGLASLEGTVVVDGDITVIVSTVDGQIEHD